MGIRRVGGLGNAPRLGSADLPSTLQVVTVLQHCVTFRDQAIFSIFSRPEKRCIDVLSRF
jgi:hypothetical protein